MDEKPTTGIYLSLAGGALVVLGGAVNGLSGATSSDQIGIILGLVGVAAGLMMIFGAYVMYSDVEDHKVWGALVILLAFFSWFTSFAGFFVGFLLGLIGGYKGITWKPVARDVMKYLVSNPYELDRVFAAYDKHGLDGVVGYVRSRDSVSSLEEVDKIAITLIAQRNTLVEKSKETRSGNFPPLFGSPSKFPVSRPTGVSILALLTLIGGIVVVLFGALLLYFGDVIGAFFGDVAATTFYIYGIVFVAVGVINLFVAYGMWVGEGWARSIAIILSVLSLAGLLIEEIASAASGSPGPGFLGAFPSVVILYYLTRPNVKAYFASAEVSHAETYSDNLPRYAGSDPGETEFERAYTEDVIKYFDANPGEWSRVLSSYDKSGLEGVASYLREKDPELTKSEADTVAREIVVRRRGALKEASQENSKGEESTSTKKSAEKSWIDNWLQR